MKCSLLFLLIRSEFVLGVNSVTRMLEKDRLLLVLVCKSVHPPIIVKHLAELSAVRCCPAMLINGLDTLLCTKLKIHSAVAIGFKVSFLICHFYMQTHSILYWSVCLNTFAGRCCFFFFFFFFLIVVEWANYFQKIYKVEGMFHQVN